MGTSVGNKRAGRVCGRAVSGVIATIFAALLLNAPVTGTPAPPPAAADTPAADAFTPSVTYSLTINHLPTAGGTATATQLLSITPDTPVNITALPSSDYFFVNWTVTGGRARFADANAHTTTVTLRSDAVITANFKQTFSLTVNRDPAEGGTTGRELQSGVTSGAPVEIAATPAGGYRFVKWTVTGGQAWFANSNAPKTTVSMNTDAIITAGFRPTLKLTVNTNGGGTTNTSAEEVMTEDTPVSITATASEGHRFVNWTVTGGQAWFADANAAQTTVSMNTDAIITANFRENHTAKTPTVLVTFGIGVQSLNYERKIDDSGISLRDQDRTVTSGTTLGIDVLTIGRTGVAISTGVNAVISSDEGVSIDPSLGIGYVYYRQYHVGALLNLIANSYIIPDDSYVNPYNNQRGDLFISPTFITGYDFGGVSLGGQASYMYGIMSSVSGFKLSAGIGVNLAK